MRIKPSTNRVEQREAPCFLWLVFRTRWLLSIDDDIHFTTGRTIYVEISLEAYTSHFLPSSYSNMNSIKDNDFQRWMKIVTLDAVTIACRSQLTHHINPPLYVYMLPLLIFFLSLFLSLHLTFMLVSNRRLAQVNLGQTRQSSLHKKKW